MMWAEYIVILCSTMFVLGVHLQGVCQDLGNGHTCCLSGGALVEIVGNLSPSPELPDPMRRGPIHSNSVQMFILSCRSHNQH
jgi:hypothetical protein